jgi:uncharacterized phiE125 gp8 family phage protein
MIDATKLVARSAETITVQDTDETLEPITLDEAKKHLRVVTPDEDDYILGLITAARQMAEGRLNRTLMLRTRRQVFDLDSTSYALRKPPVVSVDEVSVLDSSSATTVLDATAFRVRQYGEDAPPEIEALPGAEWPGQLRTGSLLAVDYLAGYPVGEVPAPIIAWMKLVIGALYEQRESMVVGVSVSMIPEEFNSWLLQQYMVYE